VVVAKSLFVLLDYLYRWFARLIMYVMYPSLYNLGHGDGPVTLAMLHATCSREGITRLGTGQ